MIRHPAFADCAGYLGYRYAFVSAGFSTERNGKPNEMKHFLKTAGIATAMVAALAGTLCAQPPNPPDPATMIANQVARLTTLLDLTTSQATQITTILTTAQSSVSSLQSALQTDHTSLDTAITANNTATIDALSATIGGLQGQMLDAQAKAGAQIYALLTSTQQTKLASLGGVGALAGGPGFGGPGGPGGPGGRARPGPRP
jgi:Spy/CpxP family protein refolding chaperone